MTKEEKKKVLDFCRSYTPASIRIAKNLKDIARFEEHLNAEDVSAFEKNLLEEGIQRKRLTIEEDRKTLLLFEIAMADLDGLDLRVFRQLYAEGKQQNEVTDSDGQIMPRTSVKRRRDHAIETIGDYILQHQMDVQQEEGH